MPPPSPPSTDPSATPAAANGLGVASFICSLVGLVSCGLLSPIGLLLAIPAVFIRPRAFAIAGLVLGVFGTFWVAVAFVFRGAIIGYLAVAVAAVGMDGVDAHLEMARLVTRINQYRHRHGSLPPDLAALPERRREGLIDPWGHPYRYTLGADGKSYTISCDGPDGAPGTDDDLTLSW